MAARQFRRELRRWRTRRGLTQRALADRVRFSRETVAAVESGRRYGSQELAVRCDEVLGTGGLLTALWPRVAVEQIAADGRRGPRATGGSRAAGGESAAPGPDGTDPAARDPEAVVAAIDELRELVNRMLRVHFPTDPHRPPPGGRGTVPEPRRTSPEVARSPVQPEPRRPSPAEPRRSPAETVRRAPARILGHRH